MKTFTRNPFGILSIAALIFLSGASKAFSAVDAYIIFKASDGKTTKVAINPDGTFTSPPMKAGTYSWSFGATQTSTGPSSGMGSGRAASSTDGSVTTNVALSGSNENPTESISLNFTKIEMKYQEQDASSSSSVSPRDAASGLPTGKRMHKPLTITKELDKSSPMLYNADLGTVVVDMDGDGISGTIMAVTKTGSRMGWDIATQKKM